MIDPHELDERLEAAFPTTAPSVDARTRALAAMQVALAGEPEPETPPAGRRSTTSRLVRRIGVGALASALVLGPTAAVAERAMPGDRLYPVKGVIETVQSLFDRDARAENRVDELLVLTDRAARSDVDTAQAAEERGLADALAAAREAVVDRPVDRSTRADFDRAEAQAEAELERRLEEQRRREAVRRAEEQRRRDQELRERDRQQQEQQTDDRDPETDSPTPQPAPTRDAPRDEPTREPEPEPTREPQPEPTRDDEPTRDQPSDEPTRDAGDAPRDEPTPTDTLRTIDVRTPRD